MIVLVPTFFKALPIDSTRLAQHQKAWYEDGQVIPLVNPPHFHGEHVAVTLTSPCSTFGRHGHFYVEHVDFEVSRQANRLLRCLSQPHQRAELYRDARADEPSELNLCVSFACQALRQAGVEVPTSVRTTKHLSAWLRHRLSSRRLIHDPHLLISGDLCFSEADPLDPDPEFPAHCYFFWKYLNETSAHAEVIDNQVLRYGDHLHPRNLGPGEATPFRFAVRLGS